MPNWCYNQVAVKGDKKTLDKFYDDMTNAISEQPRFKEVKNDWNNMWLGNLFLGAGYTEKETETIHCRGSVDTIEYDKEREIVFLYYSTAWNPNYEDFCKMLDEKYEGKLKCYLLAEEEGCGVFVNTDVNGVVFPEKYFVDAYGPEDSVYEGFSSLQSALNELNRITGQHFETEQEARDYFDKLQEENEDCYLVLEEYCAY